MQCCVIEYARNVLGYTGANSTEMDIHTAYPVIDIMEDQKNIIQMGGTMRLGRRKTLFIKENSVLSNNN